MTHMLEDLDKPIGVGMDVYFRSHVFTIASYIPYYSAYKGHKFRVVSIPYPGHAELKCLSGDVKLLGCVHTEDLKRA